MISAYLAALTIQSHSSECVDAMRRDWPVVTEMQRKEPHAVVELLLLEDGPRNPPSPSHSQQTAFKLLQSLKALCVRDVIAQQRLRSVEAGMRVGLEDYATALHLFEETPFDPAAPVNAQDASVLLDAAAGSGDRTKFRSALLAVRSAHDAAMKRLGWVRLKPLDTPLAEIDGYRASTGEPQWWFSAWPKAGVRPISLHVTLRRYPETGAKLEAQIQSCSISTSIDTPKITTPPSDAQIEAVAQNTFGRATALSPSVWGEGNDTDAVARLAEPPTPGCTAFDTVLPAFASAPLLTGLEYADEATPPNERQLEILLTGSPEQQDRGIDYLLAHPDAAEPFALIRPIQRLMERGDLLQASFWFYFWQIRSAPWATLGRPDGHGALRASINSILGQGINEWIASDPAAMREVIKRAIAYEQRTPLYLGRPEGVSSSTWAKAVAKSRVDYIKGVAELDDADTFQRKMTEGRIGNGLRNGPLDHPGKPLAETWR